MSVHDQPAPGDPGTAEIGNMVRAALFAALIAVGSYIILPLPFSPVPVALQSFFILFAGLVLGEKWGTAAVAVFLLAGIVGFPVFSGGRGGLAHFAGPTGGYLVSYIPAVYLTGLISRGAGPRSKSVRALRDAVALTVATLVIYLFGVSWLAVWSAFISESRTGLSFPGALGLGMLPFLPGDLVKIVLAVGLAPYGRRLLTIRVKSREPERGNDAG